MPLQSFSGSFGYDENTFSRGAAVTYNATTIAPGAGSGVYGAPVQFIASTSSDATVIRVWNIAACSNSNARGDVVIDIMAGAAGSEYPIIEGLIFGGRNPYSSYTIPIMIPSGTRISGRVASGAARSLTWNIELLHIDRLSIPVPKRWVAYGMSTAFGVGAYGTNILAGSNNAWSAWTDITPAGVQYSHSYWIPMVGVGTATTITALNYRTQFAIGSTAEAATMVTNATGVFEGPWFTGTTTEQFGQFNVGSNPVHIGLESIIYAPRTPAASKVSARAMCDGTAVTQTTTCAILAAVM